MKNSAEYKEMMEQFDRDAGIDTTVAFTQDAGAAPVLDTWPEPKALPNALPTVEAFDAAMLPLSIRAWVSDISYRMQCPPDFPAVAALVSLSSLIGARAVIQPKERDDWRVVPNLWGLCIGRSGVKKSPALSEAMRPLERLAIHENELHQNVLDGWQLDCKLAQMQSAENEKKAQKLAVKDPTQARALLEPKDLPAEPVARRFVVNDATVEKLGELAVDNPWGLLAYRDELHGLLTSLDRAGQEGSRAFYLQSYDGNQSYTFDRISRGTKHIPRLCLSLLGGIQPGRIQEYVRGAVSGGCTDDGLLQRFGLAVWPDVSADFVYTDQWPDTVAKQAGWAIFERLAALTPASETEPVVWRFDAKAQQIFQAWLTGLEHQLRGDELHPAIVSHLSKYRKLIPALALLFAIVDTPEGCTIHAPELLRALAWGDYLQSHAQRLYAAASQPETAGAAALLAKLRAGLLQDRFKVKDIQQKGWAGLTETATVRKAALLLADFDWLKCEAVESGVAGGRPGETFTLHPCLKNKHEK